MIIALDVDDVCLDLVPAWLQAYREAHAHELYPEAIAGWNLYEYVRPELVKQFYALRTPALYLGVRPVEGAQAGVRELAARGHTLVAVTSDTAEFVPVKRAVLARYFPQIRTIVFARNKRAAVKADIFVDDGLHNEPDIILDRPWNRPTSPEAVNFRRAFTWPQVVFAVDVLAGRLLRQHCLQKLLNS